MDMNIKKIVSILASAIAIIAVSALAAFGILNLVKQKNVIETGNVLGVEWYQPEEKEFTISTKQELYELVALSNFYSFEGQTIKLGADIVINEGNADDWAEKAPAERWKPISDFQGTFDGQGHSLSGVYGKAINTPMALFTHTGTSSTIRNLKLVNSLFQTSGSSGTASFSSNGDGNFVKLYSDAIIRHEGHRVGGIIATVASKATLDECWFDGDIRMSGEEGGGLVSTILSGRVTMKHCLFSGKLVSDFAYSGTSRIGGLCARIDKTAGLVASDTLVCGKIELEDVKNAGTIVGLATAGAQISFTDTYDGALCDVTVTIGSGKAKEQAIRMPHKNMIGVKAYQWTTLDFENYWAAVDKDTPALKHFAQDSVALTGVEKEYDISWYDKTSTNFSIANEKQLYGLYILSASDNFDNKTIKLTSDVVLNSGTAKDWATTEPENVWMPIGTLNNEFAGTFDGQGHTISGLYLKDTGKVTTYNGLFGVTDVGSRIQNLRIVNSYLERTGHSTHTGFVGSIAGEMRGIVDSVYSNAIIITDGQQIGGIVGRLNYMDAAFATEVGVHNTWFDGEIRGAVKYFGGIIGSIGCGSAIKNPAKSVARITNVLNTGYITNDRINNKDGFGGQYGGGILGTDVGKCTVYMDGCVNAGKIEAKYTGYLGGVVGRMNQATTTYYVTNVYHTMESLERAVGAKTAKVEGGVITLPESMLVGYNGYQYTNLDFAKYWTVVENDTPILQQFASKKLSVAGIAKKVDTSWYKSDATTMVIDSAEDLYGFYQVASFDKMKGKTIKLGADIVLNKVDEATIAAWRNGTKTPSNIWVPVGTSVTPFAGTFDGQGHTISGIYVKDTRETTTYTGLFGVTDVGSKVSNLKITESYFERTGRQGSKAAFLGSVAGEMRGIVESVYSNAILVTDGQQVGGLVGRLNYMDKTYETEIGVHNSWFDGEVNGAVKYFGGVIGVVGCGSAIKEPTKAIARITNCLNSGYITNDRTSNKDGFGGQYAGGVLGADLGKCTIFMDSCLNTGELDLSYTSYAGGVLGRANQKETTYTISNTYDIKEGLERAVGGFTATVNGGVAIIPESMLIGNRAYQYTNLDYGKYWSVVTEETPVLALLESPASIPSTVKKKVEFDWYEGKTSPYIIDSVEDLYGFWQVSTYDSMSGKTVQLNANLDVNEADETEVAAWRDGTKTPENQWVPIGTSLRPFAGTFDGQKHYISGIYFKETTTETTHSGLFGVTSVGSKIQNLDLKYSYFERTGQPSKSYILGSIAGEMRGIVDSVKSDAVIITDGKQVGGLVGKLNYMDTKYATEVIVRNSWFAGEVNGAKQNFGGIAGLIGCGSDITNEKKAVVRIIDCLNTGHIANTRTSNNDGFGGQYAGGIVGGEVRKCTVYIDSCLSAKALDITYTTYAGEIVGRIGQADSVYTITNCYGVKGTTDRGYNGNESGDKSTIEIAILDTTQITDYYAYISTELDLKGTWMAVKKATPVLRTFKENCEEVHFDPKSIAWYKNGSSPYMIDTPEELYGFEMLVSAGKTFDGEIVKLGADIKLNGDWVPQVSTDGTLQNAPQNVWKPIGEESKSSFRGTFTGLDGNKVHSISGVYVNARKRGAGFLGYVAGSGSVENVIFKNSYITNGALRTGIVGWLDGNMRDVYADSSVYVKGAGQTGGLVGYFGTSASRRISDSWFAGKVFNPTGQTVGGIVGYVYRGNKVLNNCLFTGTVQSSVTSEPRLGGLVGGVANNGSENSKLTLSNSVSNGTLGTSATTQVGGALGYTGANVEIDCDKVYANKKCIIEDVVALSSTSLAGGNAHLNTELDLVTNTNTNGVWIATADGPELRKFSTKQAVTEATGTAVSKEWYESKAGSAEAITYEIRTVADFYGFAEIVNTGVDNFASDTVKLAADIDLNPSWTMTVDNAGTLTGATATFPNRWTPIGTSSSKFKGIFDGQKHTIRGVCVEQAVNGVGLFGYADKTAQIKNLILDNSYIKNTGAQTGAIAGSFLGTLVENVKVTNRVVVNGGGVVAGIAGIVGAGNDKVARTFNGCWVACKVYASGQIIGGILGRQWGGDITIQNCLITGEFTNTGTHANSGSRLGAFVGSNDNSGDNDLRIEDCLSMAKFTVKNKGLVGDLVGRILDTRAGDNVAVDAYADTTINDDYTYDSATDGSSSMNGIAFDKDDFATKDAKTVVPNIFKKSDNTDNTAWVTVTGSYPIPAYWQ